MVFHIRTPAAGVLATVLLACSTEPEVLCTQATALSVLPAELDEVSGIAVSRAHSGILWVHNDSEGSPLLYALDTSGNVVAEIAVSDVAVQADWEDMAVAPCPAGSCIYIGDIGDNFQDREDQAILRFAEPDPADADAGPVDRFPIRYPDEQKDAEALFVAPDGAVYIITKGRSGSISVYRYAPPLRADETVTLDLVQELSDGLAQLPDLVTGADATPDGSSVAVRTYSGVRLYSFHGDTLAQAGAAVDLVPLEEPQGEGIAVDAGGRIYLVSESGPMDQPAPFSTLECRLP